MEKNSCGRVVYRTANNLESLRQWASVVLNMEQSFDAAARLRYQHCYTVHMEEGRGVGLPMRVRITVGVVVRILTPM